jgi:hypothetical protein
MMKMSEADDDDAFSDARRIFVVCTLVSPGMAAIGGFDRRTSFRLSSTDRPAGNGAMLRRADEGRQRLCHPARCPACGAPFETITPQRPASRSTMRKQRYRQRQRESIAARHLLQLLPRFTIQFDGRAFCPVSHDRCYPVTIAIKAEFLDPVAPKVDRTRVHITGSAHALRSSSYRSKNGRRLAVGPSWLSSIIGVSKYFSGSSFQF